MKKPPTTRVDIIKNLFPKIKPYRFQQIEKALFSNNTFSWEDITTLPKEMRKTLSQNVPFSSYKECEIISSKEKDTFKAVLNLFDGYGIETVLMKNTHKSWTICISTQIGCSMGCVFCATGSMGLIRNLNIDEIIDQYRFWQYFLKQNKIKSGIRNIVFMGMGEPFLNYENTKDAINIILRNTKIGKTHITVSTVVIFPELEKILNDKSWPGVRIAISLQSANYKTRKYLVPKTEPDFILKLEGWVRKYFKKYPARRNHLTIEYVMLKNINDTEDELKELIKLAQRIERVKINLIPYNFKAENFQKSSYKTILHFKNQLEKNNITATIRKSKGESIKAGCGQLITSL